MRNNGTKFIMNIQWILNLMVEYCLDNGLACQENCLDNWLALKIWWDNCLYTWLALEINVRNWFKTWIVMINNGGYLTGTWLAIKNAWVNTPSYRAAPGTLKLVYVDNTSQVKKMDLLAALSSSINHSEIVHLTDPGLTLLTFDWHY